MLVILTETGLGSTARCRGRRRHRQANSVRVCSPTSRRVASLRPRSAGLTALTPAPRTLVQTGSCRRCSLIHPLHVVVDVPSRMTLFRATADTGGVLMFWSARAGYARAGRCNRPDARAGNRPAHDCPAAGRCRLYSGSGFTSNPRSRSGAVPTRWQVAIGGVRAQRAQPALFRARCQPCARFSLRAGPWPVMARALAGRPGPGPASAGAGPKPACRPARTRPPAGRAGSRFAEYSWRKRGFPLALVCTA